MHGRAQAAVGLGEQLALEYLLANAYDGLGSVAGMLIDRQDQLRRDRDFLDLHGRRRRFVGLQPQSASSIDCRDIAVLGHLYIGHMIEVMMHAS